MPEIGACPALDDVKGLVETGDIKLADSRAAYAKKHGADSTLTDEEVMACHAWQNDDYGIDDIVERMHRFANGDRDGAATEGSTQPE